MEKQQLIPKSTSTFFSSPETLVLQILPEIESVKILVNGREAFRIYALVFIPDPYNTGKTISCPMNYFQESVSLPEKWILNDSFKKIELSNADKLKKVIITKKINGNEEKINLPDKYSERILDYFNADVSHNPEKFRGFDCYAFVSLIANVKYFPLSPDFEYKKGNANVGDIVVLANKNNLPNAIMHWALVLGDNLFLSKFGRSGEGTQSLVEVMDLQGMMKLYNCELIYTAIPKFQASSWEGYNI
ncbi:MAG: hypothetical protein ACR2HG_14195 [Pyrinomonadaceae bacterium]